MTELAKKRPEYRNINVFTDVRTYRMPIAALVSILHRISGMIMFVLLPFVVWMLDTSLSSEFSYARFTAAFSSGLGFVPGWMVKLVVLGIISLWAGAPALVVLVLFLILQGINFLMLDLVGPLWNQL